VKSLVIGKWQSAAVIWTYHGRLVDLSGRRVQEVLVWEIWVTHECRDIAYIRAGIYQESMVSQLGDADRPHQLL